jgi:hypothetical protein
MKAVSLRALYRQPPSDEAVAVTSDDEIVGTYVPVGVMTPEEIARASRAGPVTFTKHEIGPTTQLVTPADRIEEVRVEEVRVEPVAPVAVPGSVRLGRGVGPDPQLAARRAAQAERDKVLRRMAKPQQ